MDDSSNAPAINISVIILADKMTTMLRHALQSVEWASERIVVWTGESDPPEFGGELKNIVKIVKKPGKVSNFAKLRNEAIKYAQNKWVFFLDSDEIVRMGTEKELRKITEQEEFVGVTILRRDYFLGKELKHGEVGSVHLLRIYNKDCGQYFRPVHEILRLDGKVIDVPLTIDHYAHTSISSFLNKIIQYTTIESVLRQRESAFTTYWQLFIFPPAKFIWNYLFCFGFMDGWRGLVYAVVMSVHSFAVRALLIEKMYGQKNP
jgi:hypothetical protein